MMWGKIWDQVGENDLLYKVIIDNLLNKYILSLYEGSRWKVNTLLYKISQYPTNTDMSRS